MTGSPDPAHGATSSGKRQNPTMRISILRFIRRTNVFNIVSENHSHAILRHFRQGPFGRSHETIKPTPAMRAGVANRHWRFDGLMNLFETAEKSENRLKRIHGRILDMRSNNWKSDAL